MAWSHRTTQIGGRPAQVLVDDRFRSEAPIAQLPKLNWFGVYCLGDPGGAFWPPEETAALDSLEDELIRVCEEFGHGWAAYVMRIDTRGIREYYLYANDSADLASAAVSLRETHPDYRIDFDQKSDLEWERYRTFLPPPAERSSGSFFGRLFGKK